MAEHEIIDGPYGPEVVCHAPKGACCHRRCPTGACEEWYGESCQCGPLVEVADCNAVDFIHAVGIEDCGPDDDPAYDDDGELVYRGPVVIEWDDGYVWRGTTATCGVAPRRPRRTAVSNVADLPMPESSPYGNDGWRTVRLVVEYRFRAPADWHLPCLGLNPALPLPPMSYSTGAPDAETGGPGTWRSHAVPPLEFMTYRHSFEWEGGQPGDLAVPDGVERQTPGEEQPPTVAELHVVHFQSCGCLGESVECCQQECPCHASETGGGEDRG